MNFYNKLSINGKIFGSFAFAMIICFLSIVYSTVYTKINVENTLRTGHVKSEVIQVKNMLEYRYASTKNAVQTIAEHPFTSAQFSADSTLNEEVFENTFSRYLNSTIQQVDFIDLFMLCDVEGNIIAANTKDRKGKIIMSRQLLGKNVEKQDWFVEATRYKNVFESNVGVNQIINELYGDDRKTIVVAYPVINKEGIMNGVMMGAINYKDLINIKRFINDKNSAETVSLSLVDQKEIEQQLTNVGHSLLSYNSISSDYITYSTTDKNAVIVGKEVFKLIGGFPASSFRFSMLADTSILFFLVICALFLYIGFFTVNLLSTRVKKVGHILTDLKNGELTIDRDLKNYNDDELTQLKLSVAKTINSLKEKVKFVEAIGEGRFDEPMNLTSDKDELGLSLLKMKQDLVEVAAKEKKQNWITQGLAKFVAILRSNDDELASLYDRIIQNLTNYLNANQGGLFVLTENEEGKEVFELMGCYAWDRKKYMNMQLEKGEGLVGQVWQEGEHIYLKEVPDNFVRITSGLGEANPNNVLIVPLKVNNEIYGAIELASFSLFEEHEIEFVEKLSESIASTIATERINNRTKVLLEESQVQTREMEAQAEQLRAQEEEMRQNMEEMIATQEEMERAQSAMAEALEKAKEKDVEATELRHKMEEEHKLLQAKFEAQLGIINETAIVSTTDLRGNITYANDMFCEKAKYTREELIGQPHNIVRHEDMPAAAYEDLWKTISSGKIWKGQVKNKAKDGSYYWVQATIAPIMGENGKPVEYMAVRYLITDLKEKEEALHQMMEEIKANEEKLIQINQEMEAQLAIINEVAIVSKTDLQGNITFVNEEFLKWSKYTEEEVIGQNHRILKSGDQDDQLFVDMWKTIASGKVFRGEIKNKAKDGSFYWVDAIIAPVIGEDGKPKEYIAQRFVINEKKALEKEIEELRNQLGK